MRLDEEKVNNYCSGYQHNGEAEEVEGEKDRGDCAGKYRGIRGDHAIAQASRNCVEMWFFLIDDISEFNFNHSNRVKI